MMANVEKKMTPEKLEIIAQHREAGRSIEWIAKKIGVSQGLVSWNCLKHGIESPRNARKVLPQTKPGPLVVKRGGHVVRSFTPEEDAKLIELEGRGLNPSQIGRELGRKPNSVRGRLMTLARQDERRATAADFLESQETKSICSS